MMIFCVIDAWLIALYRSITVMSSLIALICAMQITTPDDYKYEVTREDDYQEDEV